VNGMSYIDVAKGIGSKEVLESRSKYPKYQRNGHWRQSEAMKEKQAKGEAGTPEPMLGI